MLTIIALIVTAVIAYGAIEFLLSLCRDNCWVSLLVWGFAFATGAVIPWLVIDGIVSMTRSDI